MALLKHHIGPEIPFPPEVRNLIHGFLLTTDQPIIIDPSGLYAFDFGSYYLTTISKGRPELNILAVNRATQDEALPVFYNTNTFTVNTKAALCRFARYNPVGRWKLSNIKHFVIEFRYLNMTRFRELEMLRNLEQLTLTTCWELEHISPNVYPELNLSRRDGKYGETAFETARRSIVAFAPRVVWESGGYNRRRDHIRTFMLARPEVRLQQLVVRRGYMAGSHKDHQCPKVEMTFDIFWDDENGGFTFQYECEQPVSV